LANAGKGIIKLDAETFDVLLDPKRTWSASVQLTAMDSRRGCHPCRAFDSSWTAVAKSWSRVPKEQRDQHFFATLDFEDGSTIFQRLGLSSAPLVFSYPLGVDSPFKYDFGMGFEAEPLAEFLSKHTPIAIPYTKPFDWSRYITIATGILSALLLVRFLSPVIQSKWTWAAGTVIVSLVMTSGFMFTRIRGVPYTGGNGNWIAQGYQNQFGQEVQVVSFIYGLLSFSFLVLTMLVPYQSSPSRQRIQVYLSWFVIMFVYSVLISLFRIKNRGYPFKLLF